MDDAISARSVSPNNLEACWMPFTANRQFKSHPRLLVAAEGMHYTTADGQRVLDGTAGLWCVNAGHARREIHQRQKCHLLHRPPFRSPIQLRPPWFMKG